MSVRKRLWFTTSQVKARARAMAAETGRPWRELLETAQREADDLLRRVREKDAAAIATLKSLASDDAPKEAWLVAYVDQEGKRRFQQFERKKEADEFHSTVRVDVAKGVHTPLSKSLTVAEAADVWIKGVEADGRERTTLDQYRQHVEKHIKPRVGNVKLAQWNKSRSEALRDSLLSTLSRPMARKVLTTFKSILKKSQHAHLADGVTIGRDKRAKRRLEIGVDIPEPKEVRRIVEAAKKPKDRAMLLVVAQTGLRASELRGLRWSDVDLTNNEICVRQRADRYNAIGNPKSESGVRTIPLPPPAAAALATWKTECPASEHDLVFPTSTGRIEHHKNMLRNLASVIVAAGVVNGEGKPKYALHAFRHFFASWCLNPVERGGLGLGGSPKEIQALLGHSSIVMTLDIYGHLFPASGDRAKLAAASAALFGEAT